MVWRLGYAVLGVQGFGDLGLRAWGFRACGFSGLHALSLGVQAWKLWGFRSLGRGLHIEVSSFGFEASVVQDFLVSLKSKNYAQEEVIHD